ncbi:hypothetical protein GMORB2_7323 [Geosmithia morbida]|uniref:Uncharacterized protein n=1 Tax=Geosmithia morbida TaxID=1094350 RepID=A0A9P4YSJ4_9HYPO|nr:uncharacterized protein GMORB2_7323 [Geosmithia morbida]KAF4122331.1 hypothetical protein GMORB2_7323 [Geosmithia morbida]
MRATLTRLPAIRPRGLGAFPAAGATKRLPTRLPGEAQQPSRRRQRARVDVVSARTLVLGAADLPLGVPPGSVHMPVPCYCVGGRTSMGWKTRTVILSCPGTQCLVASSVVATIPSVGSPSRRMSDKGSTSRSAGGTVRVEGASAASLRCARDTGQMESAPHCRADGDGDGLDDEPPEDVQLGYMSAGPAVRPPEPPGFRSPVGNGIAILGGLDRV